MFFNKKAKLLKQKEEELLLTLSELQQVKENLQKCTQISSELQDKFSTSQTGLQLVKQDLQRSYSSYKELNDKYSWIIDKDKTLTDRQEEIKNSENRLHELNEKYKLSLGIFKFLETEVSLYQETLDIGYYGLYDPQFSYDTTEQYKFEIERNYEKQKSLIKEDKAIICKSEWTVSGSKSEGTKMTNHYKRLMMFAFNGECNSLIAKVKWNNATKSKERIFKAFENINRLGITHNTEITNYFLDLKLEEFSLTYEYELKRYEEKEEQRRIREQMREEEKAQKEFERAQKDAEEEESRYQKALNKVKQELSTTSVANVEILKEQIKLLEIKLLEAHNRKERAIALAQLTKVGHIYIISNLGSFGENVYKIGMTRRLDPLDRVKELGDASVPFLFDIHAIIYSENAPQLESELHKRFSDRRLNKINHRKEFFRVTLDEIEAFVKQHANAEIEFTKLAEAREYRETITMLEQLNLLVNKPNQNTNFPESLL